MTSHPERDPFSGAFAAVAAFGTWGLVPLYWKLLLSVPSPQILVHRILWSLVFAAVLLALQRRWGETRAVLNSPRLAALALLCSILIGANWCLFIWAVNAGFIVETSMGYFLTPIVNVLLGLAVFGERLRPAQWIAVACAASGIAVLTLAHGSLPWIALVLCCTFAAYGALRKLAHISPLTGLFLEAAPLALPALFYWIWTAREGTDAFLAQGPGVTALLVGGGLLTAFPLLWFAHAAQNLNLTTLAFLQYLAPSLSCLVGVVVYREPFGLDRQVAFGLIWLGCALFLWEISRARSQKEKEAEAPSEF